MGEYILHIQIFQTEISKMPPIMTYIPISQFWLRGANICTPKNADA